MLGHTVYCLQLRWNVNAGNSKQCNPLLSNQSRVKSLKYDMVMSYALRTNVHKLSSFPPPLLLLPDDVVGVVVAIVIGISVKRFSINRIK